MKESFSIFSAISNLFEERQGLEKSGREDLLVRRVRRLLKNGRAQRSKDSSLSSRLNEGSSLTGSKNLPREAGQPFQSRKRQRVQGEYQRVFTRKRKMQESSQTDRRASSFKRQSLPYPPRGKKDLPAREQETDRRCKESSRKGGTESSCKKSKRAEQHCPS
jgi:hypothetical protein